MTATLTPRELEVLGAYAALGDHRAVGTSLGLSLQTIKNHLRNAYLKLDVPNALGAFRAVGWLRPPQVTDYQALRIEAMVARFEALLAEHTALLNQMRTSDSTSPASGSPVARSSDRATAVTPASSYTAPPAWIR